MKKLKKFKGDYLVDEDNNLYLKKGDKAMKLSFFDKHYYSLRVFSGVPVLEIDGLRMQLVRDFKTPLDYAKQVVGQLKIKKKDVVLDTCMGLGYTAINAAKKAKKVYTYELSEAVLKLAQLNPFSKELFEMKHVVVGQGSCFDKIKELPDESIDVIIHDPPRFSHAPELYSSEFYMEIKRVLKPGGRMFHYVGSVGKSRRRDISKDTMKRLSSLGFSVKKIGKLQGILAVLKRF